MTLSTLLRATILALGLTGLSAAASANALDDIKAAKKSASVSTWAPPFMAISTTKCRR